MHHLLSHEVNNVWKYERISESFFFGGGGKGDGTIFKDLYKQFVEPYLRDEREKLG